MKKLLGILVLSLTFYINPIMIKAMDNKLDIDNKYIKNDYLAKNI